MITVIDIETGPLPDEHLAAFKPKFEAAKNLKDPEKVAASIAEKEKEWLDRAALSAVTGEVLAIGILQKDNYRVLEGNEADILHNFWREIDATIGGGGLVVGFYITTFDLVFAAQRSWAHGLIVPRSVRKGRYWSDSICDLADRWSCGSRDPRDRISLDTLSRFLGIGAKNGDGKDFAELWKTDKPKAIEYLKCDLALTQKAYMRMV